MPGQVVEERAHVPQDLFSRRYILRQHAQQEFVALLKDMIESGLVEGFLVTVVVVEQSLVDFGGAGDGVGAGAGDSFASEFAHGRLQDGGARFFGASARTETGTGWGGRHGDSLLTNQLVRLYRDRKWLGNGGYRYKPPRTSGIAEP